MGTRGPIPKRSEERRRRNVTDSSGNPNEITALEVNDGPVEIKGPNPDWHPAALAVWEAAMESPVRALMEKTDWAVLALTCSQISQEYRNDLIIEKVKLPMHGQGEGGGEELVYGSRPMPAGKFSAIMKTLGNLGFTEGDRRRMRVEIKRGGEPKGPEPTKEGVIDARERFLEGGR